jgi:hypothetical protein
LASGEDLTAALRVDVASEIGGAVRVHTHRLVRGLDHFRVENHPFGLLTMIVSLEPSSCPPL